MKKLKIFKFKQGQTLDLTNSPEFGCNVIECGKNRFTLRDFKIQEGHDDSLPYSAILCINDKPICQCLNDGWGGMTEMKPLDAQSKALMASCQITLSKYKWKYRSTEFVLDLEFIANSLACTLSNGL